MYVYFHRTLNFFPKKEKINTFYIFYINVSFVLKLKIISAWKKVREMALKLDANKYKYQFFAENLNTSYITFLIDHYSRLFFLVKSRIISNGYKKPVNSKIETQVSNYWQTVVFVWNERLQTSAMYVYIFHEKNNLI